LTSGPIREHPALITSRFLKRCVILKGALSENSSRGIKYKSALI
jgi:hypothetical protein